MQQWNFVVPLSDDGQKRSVLPRHLEQVMQRTLFVAVSHSATDHQRLQFVSQFDLLPRRCHVLLALDVPFEIWMRLPLPVVLLRERQLRLIGA